MTCAKTRPVSAIPHRPTSESAPSDRLYTGLHDLTQWQVNFKVPCIAEEKPFSGDEKYIPHFRKIEDYCPVRHRVAIMRVLRAINGKSLLLNSAARMWTVAQVAIHLEVPRVVVSSHSHLFRQTSSD